MPIIYHISVLLYSIGKRGLLLLGSISAALSGPVPEGPPRGRECGLLSRTAVGNQAYPSLRAPFFFSLPLLPGPIPTPIPLMLPKQVRLVETYINLLSLPLQVWTLWYQLAESFRSIREVKSLFKQSFLSLIKHCIKKSCWTSNEQSRNAWKEF